MDTDINPEPLAATESSPAKWGTAGEYCYCTTGSSDFCDFCDEWVGKCWCWDSEGEDDGNEVGDD